MSKAPRSFWRGKKAQKISKCELKSFALYCVHQTWTLSGRQRRGFRRHTGCSADKAVLLAAGRIITGTQQIITPMIGHEAGVGGRSNFLS